MLHNIEVGPLNMIHSDVLKRVEAVENVEAYIGTIGKNENIESSEDYEDILQTKRSIRFKEVATYNVAPCLSCGVMWIICKYQTR